ncbi:MAG: hypothetical protein ACLR6J_00235 [Parabacteroides merdae]
MALSWLFLFAGIGTMEQRQHTGGKSALVPVWFFFSYMLIGNEAACLCELDRFEEWMVRLLGGSDKDKQSGLGLN